MKLKYPQQEPKIRLGRIREAMAKKDLDAIIFYSCQWKIEVLHYVSNFRIFGKDACMVLPREGSPTLFLSQPWDIYRAREESWIEDIQVASDEEMMTKAGKLALSYGKRIGLIGAEIMVSPKYKQLTEALAGCTVSDEYATLDELAKVKTDWEVEIMRESAKIADAGYLAEINALREGISECELVAEIEYAMKKLGADENFQMVGMGTKLPSMNRAQENHLKMGDLVLTEITPILGSITYATQLCRTVKMGQASSLEREKYGLLCTALDHALSQMRAGIPAKQVAIWQNEVIGGAGYEKYCHPPYMRSRGHNFGLGLIDLGETNEEILQENMVLVVHPNQMIPEVSYLACGLTVRVKEGGVDILSALSTELFEAEPAR